jgi:hypothetical protein
MRGLRPIVLSTILLLSILFVSESYAQEQSLTVYVYDLEGRQRQGIEMVLSNSTFRRTFATTAQGRAEFRVLSPGIYNLTATLDGVAVAQETIEFPRQTSVNLTIQVRSVRITVKDLSDHPVQGLVIELRSSKAPIARRGNTGPDGSVVLSDTPLSALPSVGPYTLTGRLGGVVVLNKTLEVSREVSSYNLTASVARLGLELLDAGGNPLNATAALTSSRLNYTARLSPQRPVLVPTSDIAGTYTLIIERNYEGVPEPIQLLREEISVFVPRNMSMILDVGDLLVRVQDDAGDPLRGLVVELSSDKLGLISRVSSGAGGVASFKAVPFSEGRPGSGPITVTAYKDGFLVGNLRVMFLPGSQQHTLVASRVEAVIRVEKMDGAPLPEALVRLVDQVTRKEMSRSSDREGRVSFRLLPGPHDLTVTYMGVTVLSGWINATAGDNVVVVRNVDIPFSLQVVDWLGTPITSAAVEVEWRGGRLGLERTSQATFSGVLPVFDRVIVDVEIGGETVERRVLYISSPGTYVLRIRGALLGGMFVEIETLASIVLGLALVLVVASSFILSRQRRARA